MSTLQIVHSGVLYCNPIPHVYSRQAYFPSVVVLANGEMLASFTLGEAFESADLHSHIARSVDGGKTWQYEGELFKCEPQEQMSDSCRLMVTESGEVVANVVRHHRFRQNEGLANPENLGFVEIEMYLIRSQDHGRTWGALERMTPPLEGPSFELNASIVVLSDGRWVLPTSTWRGWDGYCPNGMKMVGFVSDDQGTTWSAYWDVMVDEAQHVIFWESKIAELNDGRILAGAWAFDESKGIDLPNHYAIGNRAGEFSAPRSTGLLGQTLAFTQLDNGKVLTVYRRIDEPGLWANIAAIEGEEWVNQAYIPLWGAQVQGLTGQNENMVSNFNVLKFGAPSICRLGEGQWYVVFWGVENNVSQIHWLKLSEH